MSIDFKDLKLQGSFIREFKFVPSRSLRIELRTVPEKGGKQISVLYELVFDQVRWFRSSLEAEPWLEIKSHNVVLPSDYLQRHTPHQSKEMNEPAAEIRAGLSHFQLILEEGQIDIVAEHFTASAIEEIQVIGRDERSFTSALSSHFPASPASEESTEMRCAFCGRDRAEVTKIITGSEANICRDCVMICVGLIEDEPKSAE